MTVAAGQISSRSGESSPLPFYLTFLRDHHVVFCSLHGSSYAASTLGLHLLDKHQVKMKARKEIMAHLAAAGIAATPEHVSRPADGNPPLIDLPTLDGFECKADSGTCRSLSVSEVVMRRHCRTEHSMRASAIVRPTSGLSSPAQSSGYRSVKLQTLFTKKTDMDYFTVVPVPDAMMQPHGQHYVNTTWAV
jgi:hypothetical protein